jgi:hypothetical protein
MGICAQFSKVRVNMIVASEIYLLDTWAKVEELSMVQE